MNEHCCGYKRCQNRATRVYERRRILRAGGSQVVHHHRCDEHPMDNPRGVERAMLATRSLAAPELTGKDVEALDRVVKYATAMLGTLEPKPLDPEFTGAMWTNAENLKTALRDLISALRSRQEPEPVAGFPVGSLVKEKRYSTVYEVLTNPFVDDHIMIHDAALILGRIAGEGHPYQGRVDRLLVSSLESASPVAPREET